MFGSLDNDSDMPIILDALQCNMKKQSEAILDGGKVGLEPK